MGTKIHCRSYLPEFCSMRDRNEDSSSSSWPVFYGDNTVTNGQYCNGYMPINGYPGNHEKEAMKQKMLEHEAVFKNQVSELHRLYRVQRDMMEEVKRKELHKNRASIEPASSSSLQGRMPGFPLLNSGYGGTPTSEIELTKSPMSCTKGNATIPGQFLIQNGPTSKDAETTESRPSKVRKKLFDLHLPAEEYMDTEEGEKLQDNMACKGNPSNEPGSSMKLLHDNCGGMAGPIGLADLNDPAQVDDATAPSSVDFLGHTSQNDETRGIIQPTKPNPGYSSFENKVNERGQFLHAYEAGSTRSNLSSVVTMPLPSHPMHGMLNQFHNPSGIYSSGYNRADRWKEGPRYGLDFFDRTRERRNNNHLGPVTSHTPGLYPFSSSTHAANSWDQSASSWPKPANSFAPNLDVALNSAAAVHRSFQPSGLNMAGKWQANANSWANPGLGIQSKKNGFYEASTAGSKGLPFTGTVYLNHSTNHVFGNFPKGSGRADSKPVIDINLNEAVSRSSSEEVAILQDLNKMDGQSNPADHLSALPWLKPKSTNEDADCQKNVNVTDLNQHFPRDGMLASTNCENARKKEIAESPTVKKLLGFPIFETVGTAVNEVSISESVDCHPESQDERKKRMIDINVACEPDRNSTEEEPTVDKEEREKCARVRDCIDLNSCASDSEDPPVPCCQRKSASVKTTLKIDLEAPASLESDEDDDNNMLIEQNLSTEASVPSLETKNEQIQDEVLKNAAKMLVAVSSYTGESTCLPSGLSLDELVLCFLDAVASCANECDNTSGKELRSKDGRENRKEVDEFEIMTLHQPETNEEDYMPKPFVPEVQIVDDTGSNALPARSRRGPSRRGRQRRDFQRDILPGMASLSRHEVTEDIQTFAGIMRATGHSWSSGLTRRNGTRGGGARGRRRAVAEPVPTAIPAPVSAPPIQQCANIEAGLEDRSLMGWGKTTRRPRRQRCPAGNTCIAMT